MIARPFSVHHVRATTPCVLQMQVRFKELELIGEVLARLDEILQAVASFANLGGVASKDSFNFVIAGRKQQHETCHWEFSISNVDVSILMILVNLVHSTDLEFGCIEEVVLQSSFLETESDILCTPHLPKITYPFQVENITEGRRVTVIIAFADITTYDQRGHFIKAWELWVTLAEAGAYCDKKHLPSDIVQLLTEPPLVNSLEIAFLHDRFNISLTSLSGLLHIFSKLHTSVALIDEVVLS